jgi:hypothetical protein
MRPTDAEFVTMNQILISKSRMEPIISRHPQLRQSPGWVVLGTRLTRLNGSGPQSQAKPNDKLYLMRRLPI